nr:EpsG family protein [uncultured Draconibacterium sp.]
MLESLLIYNIAGCFAVVLALLSQKAKHFNHVFLISSFMVLFLVSALRFDIGYDYDNYVNSFKQIYNQQQNNIIPNYEYFSLYKFVCKIFSFSPNGYVFVIATYTFLTLFFLYKVLIHYKILAVGLFIYLCYNMLFITYDQIRQGLAISIFLFSSIYIEKRRFWPFFITIIAATLVHLSALFLLPAYLIKSRKKVNLILWYIIILLFTIGYYTHLWEDMRQTIFKLIPYYNFYLDYQNQLNSATLNSNIGVAYLVLSNIIILYYLRKYNYYQLFYFTAIGVILYLFASNNLNIWRFANYFLFFQSISIGLIVKKTKVLHSFAPLYFIITAFIMFQMNIKNSSRGTTPYKSIFSRDYINQRYEPDKD